MHLNPQNRGAHATWEDVNENHVGILRCKRLGSSGSNKNLGNFEDVMELTSNIRSLYVGMARNKFTDP
jgi:hypothetical protein